MSDRLISIDTASAAGDQFPQDVQDELSVFVDDAVTTTFPESFGLSLAQSDSAETAWDLLTTDSLSESQKTSARSTIGADRGVVDLRDWDAIRDGKWKTSNGVVYTSGQYTLTGTTTPFTAADIGNAIVVKNDVGGFWAANIVDVADGVAEIDIPCPFSVSIYGQRASWGADITEDLNDALSSISSSGEVKSVFLSGVYRATQIEIPDFIMFSGAGWGDYQVVNAGGHHGLRLWQLPGSECDFVVFNPTNPAAGSYFFGPLVLKDMTLQGPERVTNRSVTVGNGLSFVNPAGHVLSAQDGVQIVNVQSAVFPQSGFKVNGGVPTYMFECRTWYNSEYGIDVVSRYDGSCQVTHLLNYSADGNNLGAIRFKDLVSYDSVVITAMKSEMGGYTTEGDPGYQKNCVIFEDCDDTTVSIQGLSHIAGYPFNQTPEGAGPLVSIISDSGKRPRITFAGLSNRVTDAMAAADCLDSVTIRDAVAGVDVPRSVTSGVYPLGASTCGHSSETVTSETRIGYFTDHTVFIGDGGQPELPAAVGRSGARCKFINVTDGDVTAVIDGGVVALLCGDDQADTSTTITDTSLLASNWTAHGSAQIDTSVKKYGAGSIQFDGVNSYISSTADVDNFTFGVNDFTIECWLYLSSADYAQYIFDFRDYGTYEQVVPSLVWNSGSSNELRYVVDADVAIASGSALSATTWYHVALCRATNNTRLFVDGVQVGDTLLDANDYLCSATGPIFGSNAYNLTGPLNGRLDDIRISTIARYISDFTPPSKAAEARTALLGAEASVTVESDGSEWRLS